MDWKKCSVLITGGTGSFGKKFSEVMLKEYHPKKLIIFSRDELKQYEMRLSGFDHPNVRYFIGDVRDLSRLRRAFKGVDIVVHAAAMKQVPTCEYNPIEAIMTNVVGARNVIDAALDLGVKKVMGLSTDKAVNPVNLYGATKLCKEKLFIQSNAYTGGIKTRFSCVRYGNVIASRGSVIPLFLEQVRKGKLTVTDSHMTRFWITLEQGVKFVILCLENMLGGEVFVPKIPTMRLVDVAKAIAPNCKIEYTGIRPGEKIHEVLISEDEARRTIDCEKYFIVKPAFKFPKNAFKKNMGKEVAEDFEYNSSSCSDILEPEEMKALIG